MDSAVTFGRIIKNFGNVAFFSITNAGTTAICSFIGTKMADDEDIKRLRPVFQMLDKNQQGFLTLDDLKLQMMDYNETQHSAEKIFKAVDTDCKGRIDFQDFLWAASDIEKVLSPENLRIAFNMFAGMNKSG